MGGGGAPASRSSQQFVSQPHTHLRALVKLFTHKCRSSIPHFQRILTVDYTFLSQSLDDLLRLDHVLIFKTKYLDLSLLVILPFFHG